MSRLSITWLGHATFIITTPGGKRIVTDPWLEGNPACPADRKRIDAADLILLTHGHSDHSGDVVNVARATNAPVVAVHELSIWLQRKGLQNVVGMGVGGTVKVAGLDVSMVPAVHTSSVVENDQIVYLGVPTGFVVRMEDGRAFYFAGDTALFGDMRLIGEDAPAGDRVPADRRPLHDGTRCRRPRRGAARRPAGRADALRDVPAADRHPRPPEAAGRARRRRRAGAEAGRDGVVNPWSVVRGPWPVARVPGGAFGGRGDPSAHLPLL